MSFYPAGLPVSDNTYFSDRAQLFVTPYGEDYELPLGDFEQLQVTWNNQKKEIIGNDSTIQLLRRSETFRFGGTIAAGLRQKTEFTKDILFASDPDALPVVQPVIAAGTKEFALVKKGRLYKLGAIRVTDVVVTDGDDEELVELTDYFVDYATGHVQAMRDLEVMSVAFKAPTVSARHRAIGSKPTQFYGLRIRQINEGGDDIYFGKVSISVDGTYDLASDGSAFGNVGISIEIMVDPLAPPGFELGVAVPIGDAIDMYDF